VTVGGRCGRWFQVLQDYARDECLDTASLTPGNDRPSLPVKCLQSVGTVLRCTAVVHLSHSRRLLLPHRSALGSLFSTAKQLMDQLNAAAYAALMDQLQQQSVAVRKWLSSARPF
jgi:hypothetical protein